jgi:UDP:flavonoid glycosyltransferase YjiC (YdhE family)
MPLFAGDQWRTAARVAQLGAGIQLANGPRRVFEAPGAELIAALPGAVRRVLDAAGYAAAARKIAEEAAGLAPMEDAVDLLAAATGSAAAPGQLAGS